MLASDSDEDAVNESTGYILRNEPPNVTNLLEIEQSGIYQPLRSFRFDSGDTSKFKFPPVKPTAKPQRKVPVPDKVPLDHFTKLFERSDKQLDRSSINRSAFNHRKAPAKSAVVHQSSSPPEVLDKSDDQSDFDCDIPSELYSVVEGRKVFRLFNHIEHVKENSLSSSNLINNRTGQPTGNQFSSLADEQLVYSTDNSQPRNFLESYSRYSSKENFRANTLPDESRFCNFLNQSKFDTLIDDHVDGEKDEFRTLTESNNRINNNLSNAGKLSSEKGVIYPKERSLFNSPPNESYLNEIYNNKTQNRSFKVGSIREAPNEAPKEALKLCPATGNETSRYLSDHMSIDNTKENDNSSNLTGPLTENAKDASTKSKQVRSSISLNISLTRDQSNYIVSNVTSSTAPAKPIPSKPPPSSNRKFTNLSKQTELNSRYDPSTLTNLNEESLDVFRDFSDNMAKLNETGPSFLNNIESANQSSRPRNLDDELSMNISPIKPANNLHKENFFKTPFKMPSIREANQRDPNKTRNEPVDQLDANRDEFVNKNKLQSTFVDSVPGLRRSRLTEEEIRQNLEKELQKLKLRNELESVHSKEPSELTRRMELTKQLNLSRSNRTSDLLEKTRNKIEEYKRQQLERTKSDSKLNSKSDSYDSTFANILGASRSLSRRHVAANSNTYTKHGQPSAAKNRTVDQSELDNDKFRLIEEQLRLAEMSSRKNHSSTNHGFLSAQSLRENSVGSLNRSAKSASSISRAEDLLSSEDSNDRTLTGNRTNTTYSPCNQTGNQTFSLHNLNLEEQKTHLEFLNSQLIKVKDLEDKSELIKRRAKKKDSNPLRDLARAASSNHLSSDSRVRPALNRASSDKQLSTIRDQATSPPPPRTDSTETSDSLRTLSLNTISPSSIDLSEQSLDSILRNSSEKDELSFHSAETDEAKRTGDAKLSKVRSNNNNEPNGASSLKNDSPDEEGLFHCRCCQRNRLVLMNDIETQTTLPVNNLTNFSNLNTKETEQYDQFAKQLDRIMIKSNQPDSTGKQRPAAGLNLPQINRKQTFNKLDLLIKPQLNNTFSRPAVDKSRLTNRSDSKRALDTIYDEEDDREELEKNLNLNDVSLNEIFKARCPGIYSNIQQRSNLIQKQMQSRKELEELRRVEAERALKSQQKRKHLNRPSNLMNRSQDLRIRKRT